MEDVLPNDVIMHICATLSEDQASLISFAHSSSLTKSLAKGFVCQPVDLLTFKIQKRSKLFFSNLCSEAGYLDLLLWGHEANCSWGPETFHLAAKKANLPMLKVLREKGCTWVMNQVCEAIAGTGNLEVLAWALDNGCFWCYQAEVAAAEHNRLEVIEWVKERGCTISLERICSSAATGGHLDLMRWAYPDHHCWSFKTYCNLAIAGHVDALRQYWDKGNLVIPIQSPAWAASVGGHVPMFKFFVEQDPNLMRFGPLSPFVEILEIAEASGVNYATHKIGSKQAASVEALKFLFSRGCKPATIEQTKSACANFEALKCIVENGGILGREVFKESARQCKDPSELQWLLDHGCDWCEAACDGAAVNKNIEVLKWLHNQKDRTLRFTDYTMRKAARAGNLHIVRWLHENGCPWSEAVTDVAIYAQSTFELFKYLVDNGCPVHPNCARAGESGHLEILRWLRNNGYHVPPSAITAAAIRHHWDIAYWWIAELQEPYDVHVYAACRWSTDPRILALLDKWDDPIDGFVSPFSEM